MIAANVPMHLVVAARMGFLRASRETGALWQNVAMQVDLDGASADLVDLGAAPMPKENKTGTTVQDFIERTLTVQPKSWDITAFISKNAVDDDRTGTLRTRVSQAGANFNKHINKIVFEALNVGEASTTYGAGYDGQPLFSDSHVDPGSDYATAQDNKFALTLSLDNYETVRVAQSMFRDDRGEVQGYIPDLLVVPPHLERTAAQIATNAMAAGTANNDINPYSGATRYIVAPWIDSTAWFTVVSNDPVKPLMLIMREQPALQSAWFDPDKPDGGHFYFKFYARYNVAYGDWRLVAQGNT